MSIENKVVSINGRQYAIKDICAGHILTQGNCRFERGPGGCRFPHATPEDLRAANVTVADMQYCVDVRSGNRPRI